MKMVAGLGNPGKKYEGTRHNVGFLVLDKFVEQTKNFTPNTQDIHYQFKLSKKYEGEIFRIGDLLLVKPQTFMNRSGQAVAKLIRFYKVDFQDLYVVHDDLDIELGKYKIQLGKGPRIHNGLHSVYKELGSKDFWHVRLGIAGKQFQEVKSQKSKVKGFGRKYVLQRFAKEENEIIDEVVDKVVGDLVKRLHENTYK